MPERLPTGDAAESEKLLSGTIDLATECGAARYYCPIVGRLLPANSAYAAASYQLTPFTG